MAIASTGLTPALTDFIMSQPLFFVATAAAAGSVNISPKGLDSLRVIDSRRIVWLNLSGSGNETAAHVRQSPRMTLMFCAFTGAARILRVYGRAAVMHPGDEGWDKLAPLFPVMAGSRQIFDLTIDRLQTSCGSGVPVMEVVRERGPTEMLPFYEEMGPEGVRGYWARKNRISIDGFETGTG